MRKAARISGFLVPLAVLGAVALLAMHRGRSPGQRIRIVPLTFDPPGVSNQFPVASPDGRWIAFQRCEKPVSATMPSGQTRYHFDDPKSNWDLYRINLDGTGLLRLTDSPGMDDAPAWSPDGKTIAYESAAGSTFGIWLMNSDGSNRRLLLHDDQADSKTPAFSPDGSQLVFYSNRPGPPSWNLFVLDLSTRQVKQLTSGAHEDRHPLFSPDGGELIFHSDRSKRTIQTARPQKLMTLYSRDLRSRQLQELGNPGHPHDDRHAFVSPDGRCIVYHSTAFVVDPENPGRWKKAGEDIWIASRDGKDRINVTRGDRRHFKHPSWSADGQGLFAVYKDARLAESSERGGGWNLCSIDVREILASLGSIARPP